MKTEAFKFFDKLLINIEVVRDDNQLEKVYFIKYEIFSSLTSIQKKKFNLEVKRLTSKTKCIDLQTKSTEIIASMKRERQLLQLPLFKFVSTYLKIVRRLAFLFAILINFFILLSYSKYSNKYWYQNLMIDYGINILGFGMLVLTVCIVFYNVYERGSVILKAWEGQNWKSLDFFTLGKCFFSMCINIFKDVLLPYYLIYGLAAFLGLFLHHFFFAFHLFDVLVNNKILLSVVKSVWRPKKELILTSVMFAVIVYAYAVFSYQNLRPYFETATGSQLNSIFDYFIVIYDKSFKFDGGVGGYLADKNELDDENIDRYIPIDFTRLVYDNSFVIIVVIIMINIVSGLIIDNFGSLREEDKQFNQNINNLCFICGFDKETFEKVSEKDNGFEEHIKTEHNQWNYLFFIAYLKTKEKTEFSGLESYVFQKIENDDVSWFPCGRSLALEMESRHHKDETITGLLEVIKEQVIFCLF